LTRLARWTRAAHNGPALSGLREAPDRTAFVGRQTELARLRAGLDRAFEKRGSLFLLGGEPGVGKTRLAEEIAGEAEERGAAVHWGRATQAEGAPAYWPWLQILRSVLQDIGDADFVRVSQGDLPQILQAFPELRHHFSDAAVEEAEEGSRFRTYDAIARFLLGVASIRPTVLILDDLHWADAASLILLRQVADAIPRSRLVVIVTYRDAELEPEHPLKARFADANAISLAGLDDAEVAVLLRDISTFKPAADVVQRLQAQTAGNPLFLKEIARGFRDDAGEPPSRHDPDAAGAIPTGIASILSRRILTLPDDCRYVLAFAAAAGSDVDIDLVSAAVGTTRPHLLDLLDDAVSAGVLTRRSRGFAFAHGLFRDTVNAGLTTARRAELHRLLAEALEKRPPRGAAQIAHHFVEAASADERLREKALDYSMRAGRDAFAELAYEESARHFDVALTFADSLEPRGQAELLLDVARSRYMAGDPGGAIGAAVEASRIGEELQDSELLARAALVAPEVGGPGLTTAIKSLCDAALRRPPADVSLRLRLLSQLTVALMQVPEPGADEEAQRHSLEAMRLARDAHEPELVFAAIHARQMARSGPDGVEERLELAGRALELGQKTGRVAFVHWGHSWRADALVQFGRIDEAEMEVVEQRRTADLLREPLARWRSLIAMSWIWLLRGRFGAARALSEEAHELGRLGNHPMAEFQYVTFEMALSQLTGGTDVNLDRADSYVRRYPEMGPALTVFRVLDLASRGRLAEARTTLRPLASIPPSAIRPLMAWFPAIATSTDASVAVGDANVAAVLYAALLPYSDHVITTTAGVASVLGAAARYLAKLAATMERWEAAAAHYETAINLERKMGAPPFVACSEILYAEMLVARGQDLGKARRLADDARSIAQELGMPPWLERSRAILEATTATDQPLSRRELDVAVLVSQGLSNRGIAERLHLSERTAESHVKNICDKLGFNSRSQVAAWVAARRSRTEIQ
jgi:DNA-binding CsgD family transcriptional regulator